MKAKTKLTKLWSFLLALVMLLSLLPTTALAAGSYPAAAAVLVDGGKYFGRSGKLYYKNNDPADNFTGTATDYNAAYDPDTGILTLQNYNGGSIIAGGATTANITIKLLGNNTVTGSVISDMGGDITITSESGGTLSITQTMTSSGNAAIGIETGLSGSIQTGNVTITGSADVKIEVTHNGTNGYEDAYGIFAKENITISDNASVYITCATPQNTYSNSYCNGLRADKNVTVNTDGTIKIDVTTAGADSTQSFGIYPMGNAALTKVGEMVVQWKKHSTNSNCAGGAILRGASFDTTTHAINVDETNCYASYRFGTPRTVMVENGTLTGPGVKYANDSGYFLAGDKVNITPATKKGRSGEEIPFKEWTSSDVTLDKSATTASNSFTVPGKDVTVTAKHSPFVGTPTFTPTGTTGTEGTLTFKTVVKADETYEGFRLVKEGNENNESSYISIRSDTTSTSSPYEYSYETRRLPGVNQVDEGNYYVVAYLNNHYYLGEKFTVDYTAAVTTYTVSFNANGGTGTMADVTDISGEYTLPENGFTAPDGKQFKAWSVGGVEKTVGDKITVTANTTVTAVWEDIPVVTYTVSFDANGGTGTMTDVTGVSGEYTLPANGFTAPAGKQFKAWSVGGVEKAVGDKITVTANTTVTAVWENIPVVTYTVSFDANGGTGTMADVTGVSGEYTLPENGFTAPAGKRFECWSVDGVEKAVGDKITVTANTTVTAVWEDIPVVTYTVSFDANGGTGTMTDVTGVSGEYTLPENGFTAPSGKQFKAWRVGGVEKAAGDKITVTANTTVTAVWEAVEYNVTVTGGTAKDGAGNDVSTNDDNRSVAAGTEITITANAAPEDYAFDKWEVVRGNVTFADATSQVTTFNMPGENVEVKATYKHVNHTYGGWESDGTNHWKECTCGYRTDAEAHSYNSVVNAKATTSKNGTVEKECSVCEYRTTDTIYYPKTIKLSTTNYTYNGKVNKPSVSIIDANGKTVSSANYNVSYATGRKSVGKYKVTVTFKGDKYSGSKYTYFYINPKGTSISKVYRAKKAFTVKWKKQSAKMATSTITGYQIRYSTSSKMTSPKYKTVKGYKYTSKKITKLKAKKKYYVQVRTYKIVSGKTYYSSWSSIKSVTTK